MYTAAGWSSLQIQEKEKKGGDDRKPYLKSCNISCSKTRSASSCKWKALRVASAEAPVMTQYFRLAASQRALADMSFICHLLCLVFTRSRRRDPILTSLSSYSYQPTQPDRDHRAPPLSTQPRVTESSCCLIRHGSPELRSLSHPRARIRWENRTRRMR